jgi:hypothetical protein
MKARNLAACALALLLAGCALAPIAPPQAPAPVEPPAPTGTLFRIDTPFDGNQAASLLRNGPNTITGSTMLRQRGQVVTCAGQSVFLVPATDYARVRVKALYGSDRRGARIDGRTLRFEPDPPDYTRQVRQARCDENGRFRFDRVANGQFFVTASLRWQDGARQTSGSLMQAVSTGGGRVVDVRLSR